MASLSAQPISGAILNQRGPMSIQGLRESVPEPLGPTPDFRMANLTDPKWQISCSVDIYQI